MTTALARHQEKSRIIRYALADIDGLLRDGFDTNARAVSEGEPYFDGLTDTLNEIKDYLGEDRFNEYTK